MSESAARSRLLAKRGNVYQPAELAFAILTRLEQMERESDSRPACSKFRHRTGLTCAAEFRGLRSNSSIEDAITMWLAESFPHAECQVKDAYQKCRPDIVFAYETDTKQGDLLVFLEAKPVWQRWITTGERVYSGSVVDQFGRGTGSYCANNIRQLVRDRDKLILNYTDPQDRHLLLALVFQRPGEVDSQVISAIGPGWEHACRHISDLCNPAGDNIGMTGFVFWPESQALQLRNNP